jgi:hypothetical protein
MKCKERQSAFLSTVIIRLWKTKSCLKMFGKFIMNKDMGNKYLFQTRDMAAQSVLSPSSSIEIYTRIVCLT